MPNGNLKLVLCISTIYHTPNNLSEEKNLKEPQKVFQPCSTYPTSSRILPRFFWMRKQPRFICISDANEAAVQDRHTRTELFYAEPFVVTWPTSQLQVQMRLSSSDNEWNSALCGDFWLWKTWCVCCGNICIRRNGWDQFCVPTERRTPGLLQEERTWS